MLAETFAPFRPRYTAAAFAATTPGAAALRDRWHEGPVWVGACGDEIAGTVSAVARPAHTYVRSMAVRPAAQGAGMGSRLLGAVFDFAAASGSPALALASTPFLSEAIRLYERHGFRRSGTADLHGTPLILMTRLLPEAVRYRAAHRADAAAIARLHAASWRENYRGILPDTFLDGEVEADRAALWHGRLATPMPDHFVEVAEVDRTVAGFVCAVAGADARWGSLIDNVHVARAHLGQGIGTALLSHAFDWLRRRDAQGGVFLWVFDRNEAARRLYDRLGGVHAETVDKPTPGGSTGRCCRYVWDSDGVARVAGGQR